MKIAKIKAPNTYLIIFSIIILMAVLTYVIPAGEFDRVETETGMTVDSESFHYVEGSPQGIGDVLMAPINGFTGAALIIGFVLLVGGVFGIIGKTEVIELGLRAVASLHEKFSSVRFLLIPFFMLCFSLGGALFGMSEEVIPLILIFVPLSLSLGYDSITGAAIPYVGAAAGFAGAFLNPFTVGIAQGIAGLPLYSGLEYRVIVWFGATIIAIVFVMRYAAKIKKHPEKSPMYEFDKKKREELHLDNTDTGKAFSKKHSAVLLLFAAGMVLIAVGVLAFQWYIEEISAVFLAIGIVSGIAARLSVKEITDSFLKGAKDLMGTAFIIALAKGIVVVAEDGKIIDTILHFLSTVIGDFHPVISSQLMFFVQSVINFMVPSGSGQAALTMPIMAPLGELVGVSAQISVLAFQFGDGFTNLIIPTSTVTMSVLFLAEIPYEKWLKWILPLILLFYLFSLIMLIPPHFFHWH